MLMSKKYTNLIIILLAFLVAGCAQGISREGLRQVDEDITFNMLLENPQQYTGKTVLLGGEIIDLEILRQQTEIIVLQHDLGFSNRPNPRSLSRGRFLVTTTQFLDPEIFRQGRWITVLGLVTGQEIRPVQQNVYAYPVIAAREIQLWPVERAVPARTRFGFGLGIGIGF